MPVRLALAAVAAILALAVLAPTASAQGEVAYLRQVSGVVTDANGNRVGLQWLTAVESGVQPDGHTPIVQRRVQRLVGGAGEFVLALPDGVYRLSVWTDWGSACALTGYEPRETRPSAVTVAGRAVGGITLVLSGARADQSRWLSCVITDGPATTTLRPGRNLVGWTGTEAGVATLFAAIPRLETAHAWDAEAQRERRAARDGSGDLRTLTPGMGLRLTLGGTEPFAWTRPATPPGEVGLVHLREGRNLVAWLGRDGIGASEAFAGLGDALVAGEGWDATAQRRRSYAPDAAASTLRTLDRGGAYWIEVSAPREWWQFPPRAVFVSAFPPAKRAELRAAIDDVVAYFIGRFGIAVPGLSVQFGDADVDMQCGAYGHGVIYLREPCFAALAHEYTHAIQHYLRAHDASGRPRGDAPSVGPVWIIEGMANYWSGVYRDAAGQRPLDAYLAMNVTPAARRTQSTLRSIEATDNFVAGDRSAHYSLAHLAIDYLVSLTNEDALFDYYRALPDAPDWRSAFRDVFGLDVDRFYRMFAERRAREFPPYARITGSVRGPDGAPLEGVRVRAHRSGASAWTWRSTTGPDGAFAHPVPPGAWRITFTNLPDADACHSGWYDGDGALASREALATPVVVADADVTGIHVRFPAQPSGVCVR